MNKNDAVYAGKHKGYHIFVSDKPNKKYYAIIKGEKRDKKVYFGDTNYEQYFDKLGHYEAQNHNDPKRRQHYKNRHEKDRHLVGSAGWFSDQILW